MLAGRVKIKEIWRNFLTRNLLKNWKNKLDSFRKRISIFSPQFFLCIFVFLSNFQFKHAQNRRLPAQDSCFNWIFLLNYLEILSFFFTHSSNQIASLALLCRATWFHPVKRGTRVKRGEFGNDRSHARRKIQSNDATLSNPTVTLHILTVKFNRDLNSSME